MTLKVTIIVGSPASNSRTREVAETVVDKGFAPRAYDCDVIDVAEQTGEAFALPSFAAAVVRPPLRQDPTSSLGRADGRPPIRQVSHSRAGADCRACR